MGQFCGNIYCVTSSLWFVPTMSTLTQKGPREFFQKLHFRNQCVPTKKMRYVTALSEKFSLNLSTEEVCIDNDPIFSCYTAGWNVWGDWVLAVYHHNHKNWVPSILTHNLWLIFKRMKQFFFFFFFEKIKFKMADSKKGHFSKSPILNIFCENSMN